MYAGSSDGCVRKYGLAEGDARSEVIEVEGAGGEPINGLSIVGNKMAVASGERENFSGKDDSDSDSSDSGGEEGFEMEIRSSGLRVYEL